MRKRALGASEIDEMRGVLEGIIETAGHANTGLASEKIGGVSSNGWATGNVESARKLCVRGAQHGLDQHSAHSAACAGNGNSHCHDQSPSSVWPRAVEH
jgi:hypothetical protein